MSSSSRPCGLQHFRIPCSSLSPGVCPNMSTELVMLSNHLLFSFPLLFLSLIFPIIRVFSNELVLRIWWPKYCSFSISPSNEYSELISFRIDWFDLFAVQGTLKSLLQHHNLKASVLWCSAFLWSSSHIHTWLLEKPQLWLWQNDSFVGKVISLVFNMLSRCIIPLPPRSKLLLISWLQSPSTVILEPKKIKCHCFLIFPLLLLLLVESYY